MPRPSRQKLATMIGESWIPFGARVAYAQPGSHASSHLCWAWAAWALMGIWLSPLAVADFCLLGLGMLYHLYSAFLASCFTSFG